LETNHHPLPLESSPGNLHNQNPHLSDRHYTIKKLGSEINIKHKMKSVILAYPDLQPKSTLSLPPPWEWPPGVQHPLCDTDEGHELAYQYANKGVGCSGSGSDEKVVSSKGEARRRAGHETMAAVARRW
jgi:hypothetical protein